MVDDAIFQSLIKHSTLKSLSAEGLEFCCTRAVRGVLDLRCEALHGGEPVIARTIDIVSFLVI